MPAEVYSGFLLDWKRSLAVAKKNAKIYYLKPPVLIFGLLFPFFMFLAFAMGRGVNPASLVPGLIGITVLFTASSVGPLIAPWERQAKTYERLISAPLSLWHIIIGDILAGFAYGLVISLVPIMLGVTFFGARLAHPFYFLITMLISVYCFAVLGTLLAALPTDQPSNVMMLSNLVRLPLLFISGVFVPLDRLPVWGQIIAAISPLSYTVDLIRWSFGEQQFFKLFVSYPVLVVYTILLMLLASLAHKRGIRKLF